MATAHRDTTRPSAPRRPSARGDWRSAVATASGLLGLASASASEEATAWYRR